MCSVSHHIFRKYSSVANITPVSVSLSLCSLSLDSGVPTSPSPSIIPRSSGSVSVMDESGVEVEVRMMNIFTRK